MASEPVFRTWGSRYRVEQAVRFFEGQLFDSAHNLLELPVIANPRLVPPAGTGARGRGTAKILKEAEAEHRLQVEIQECWVPLFRQEKRGRLGAQTRYLRNDLVRCMEKRHEQLKTV